MDKAPDAFRTISEVGDLLETPAHVLRFWETRFPQVKPVKRAGGRRYYRPADVALLMGIKRLLHDEGMTIRGVQKILREQGIRHVAGLPEDMGDEAFADDFDLDEADEAAPEPVSAEIVSLQAVLDLALPPRGVVASSVVVSEPEGRQAALFDLAVVGEAEALPEPMATPAEAMPDVAALSEMIAEHDAVEVAVEDVSVGDAAMPEAVAETVEAVAEGIAVSDAVLPETMAALQEAVAEAVPERQPMGTWSEPARGESVEGPYRTLAARLRALPPGALMAWESELAPLVARLSALHDAMQAAARTGRR